ncbi:MAG: phenylphosphate carboxylase subunit gamma [Chloroflexi bacterium]|nr:phenylphosphate carboxylase subunit gamma [Chloroflexota bacterium]
MEYVTFTPDIKDLVENQETALTIKDLTPGRHKYGARIVKAILSSDPKRLPGGDILHVRSWTGVLYPQTWAIKITGDAGEIEVGTPHSETIKAQR